MNLSEAFDRFDQFNQLKELSPKTISDYRSFVRPFLEHIGPDQKLDSILEEDVLSYLQLLHNRDIAKATRATYVRHLKCFLNYIKKWQGVDVHTRCIVVPKTSKKILHIYDDDEIRLIFETVRADEAWITARNRAIIALMLDSGLRQAEVCTLFTAEVYIKKNLIKVTGKGDKQRFVPLGKISVKYLREYARLCPYSLQQYFFIGRRGEPMSCDAVKHFIYRIAKELPFEFSSHKLRHNFGTNYCLDQYKKYGTVDIYRLMVIMGHEDVKTTFRYLHIANQIIASQEAISHIDSIFESEV